MQMIFPADTGHNRAADNRAEANDVEIHLPTMATPRLVNGALRICSLNSSFLVFLRAHPEIYSEFKRGRLLGMGTGENAMLRHIQKVLESRQSQGTDLLEVKEILSRHHPTTLAYQAEETEGYALETMRDLVTDFAAEIGNHDRWKHSRNVTEDKGYPPTCCGQILHYQSTDSTENVFIMSPVSDNTTLQTTVDAWEEKQRRKMKETTCPTCLEQRPIQVLSSPEQMPTFFTVEWPQHASTVKDVTARISWGGATYKTIGIIHHGDGHFWASLKEPNDEQDWWRVDDFGGEDASAIWRRKYVKGVRGQETSPEGGLIVHKLQEKIVLLLLEKTDAVESDEDQVSIHQICLLFHILYFSINPNTGGECNSGARSGILRRGIPGMSLFRVT